MQISNRISLLVFQLALLAGSISSSDSDDGEHCVLTDYVVSNKVLIRQDKELNLPSRLYSHLRKDEDGQVVQVYFTPCRDLPQDIKRQCGIQDSDKRSYTFVEIFNSSLCIPRRFDNMVTARHYIKHGEEQFDIVYREQQTSNAIILNFKMVDQTSNNSVSYVFTTKQRIFNTSPSHFY